MKLSKDEFKQLREYWYKVLEDSGFEDIEHLVGDNGFQTLALKKRADNCYRDISPFDRFMKEEYFRRIAQCVYDEQVYFRNEMDRFILMRHAEGAKIKEIVTELETRGTPRERAAIRFIVRKYRMAWGFKYYTPKELNIKA